MPELPTTRQPTAAAFLSYRWLVEWSCLLALVFLAGSSVNCLFCWFSYSHSWDLWATLFSIVLAGLVYFACFYSTRTASLEARLAVAMGSLAGWAVFLPMLMKAAGFK